MDTEGGVDVVNGLYAMAAGWAVYLLMSGPGRSQLGALIGKIPLGFSVVAHLLFSCDKSGIKKPGVDSEVISGGPFVATKRIIFIRHGESDWNEMFNRGFGPMFPVRLVLGLVKEVLKMATHDSIFVDSPLSSLGTTQAKELRAFLNKSHPDPATKEVVSVLRGETGSSLFVTSNLRRAIQTAVIGLSDRLRVVSRGKLYLVSHLQEISKNPDALALAKAQALPDLGTVDAPGVPDVYDVLDAAFNKGNKPLRKKGKDRLGAFADFAFTRQEDTVIAVGHSLFFKAFFNTFLPQSITHEARSKKISNCGVVAFTIAKGVANGKDVYRIEPSSINMVTGKFK